MRPLPLSASRAPSRQLPVSLACGLALGCLGQMGASAAAAAQSAQPGAASARPSASATLEQCVTAIAQPERSATFAGEMTAIPGSARLEMRIDVLERLPEEALFHAVSAPGLGVWRGSVAGVKVYRYLKQVTNLSAPAFYRAAVRFRWLSARGRLMKSAELRTATCEQPAPPPTGTPPATGAPPAVTSTPPASG
jgi:hypothetical protein